MVVLHVQLPFLIIWMPSVLHKGNKYHFKSLRYDPDGVRGPRHLDREADALTSMPSRRYSKYIIYIKKPEDYQTCDRNRR